MQKRLEQAESLLTRALPMLEKTLGSGDAEVARHFRHMSCVYSDQARYEDAANLLGRAITILEEALDAEHPEVADMIELRAGILEICNRNEEARASRKRVADIRRKLADDQDDPGMLKVLEQLPSLQCPPLQIS